MDQDLNLNVNVNTQGAVQGLNNLKGAADQAAESVGKIGQKAEETAGKVDKVGDAADKSLPKIQGLGSAFEGVFSDALQGASQLGGSVGDISKSVSKAIPVVKNLNSTALKGLTGIKAAIAATGIGALVVAIGLVASHWEGFMNVVGLSKEKFQEFKDKAVGVLGNIVAGIVGVGNVILQRLIEPVRTAIRAFTGLGNIIKDVFTGQWGKIKEDAKDAIDSIKDSWTSSWDIQGNYKKGQEAGQKFVQGVTDMINYKKPEAKGAGRSLGKEIGEGVSEGYKEAEKNFGSLYKNILDEKRLKEEAEHIRKDVLPDVVRQLEEAAGKEVGTSGWISIFTDEDVDNLAKTAIKYKDTLKVVDDAVREGVITVEQANETKKYLEEKYNKEQAKIIQERASASKKAAQDELNHTTERLKILNKLQLERQQQQNKYDEDLLQSAGYWSVEKNKVLEQLENERLNNLKKYLQEELLIETDPDRKSEILTELKAVEDERTLITIKAAEERKKIRAQEVLQLTDAAQSIASIFGTIAEAEEDRIRRQVENGDITQEEAERQFENVKKWQIAETWINTLAGMTAALTSPIMQSAGPAGWIAAAAQAATLLANGIAQTIKIKNTQFGGGPGGAGGGTAPSVGVTPLEVTDDIQASPSVLQDTQTAKDQRVYILESDIQESDKRVEVRETNTTF